MKRQNILPILGLIFLSHVIVLGQSQTKERQQEEYLLKSPEVVRIELSPRKLQLNEDINALKIPYQVGSKIYFQMLALNTSLEPVAVAILDKYVQNRPELLRDGQIVPYREGLNKLLEAKEKDPFIVLPQVVKLNPNEQKFIGYIYLDDWYEPLQPGHYQLSLKHRFEPGQGWIESSSITFEVVSKKQHH